MADLNPRNMAYIRQKDPKFHDAIMDIVNAVNHSAQQVNASPVGETPAPTGLSQISVKGGAGIADISLTDNSDKYRGHSNFVEYDTDPNFTSPKVIHLGPSRNHRVNLGSGTFHFRAYSAYPTSGPSSPIYHPAVDLSGNTPPAVQGGQGSGTSAEAGGGFGKVPFTGSQQPKR